MDNKASVPLAWLAILALLAGGLTASPAYAKWADLAPQGAPPEQKAYLEALDTLNWVVGPTTVKLTGNADLQVPDGFVFLNQADTQKYLELNENFGDGSDFMLAPQDLAWTAYLNFLEEGYVKDNEEIDAAALLKTLTEATEAANVERRKRGWGELHVVGWATPPNYNRETKRLEWATTTESNGQKGVNFFTKILGRRGHTSVQMVSDPEELTVDEQTLNKVLTGFTYNQGDTYADFKPGDKVAEYGLAALVVGGAAAVATKKGFWAVLAGFFAAAWKFVIAAGVAALAWVRSLFKKKA